MLFEPFCQGDVLHALEVGRSCLDGAESRLVTLLQTIDFTVQDESFEFFDAVSVDVFMRVVVSLATECLQDKVAVEAREAAEAVACELTVEPGSLMLHEKFQYFETPHVGFVEVVLFRV